MTLVAASRTLARKVSGLSFGKPITHVYNPLDYARRPHEQYLQRYGQGRGRVVLLGMNPGPFGMAQTGVPFGDVEMVRDFLRVEAAVDRPTSAHPKRPIRGFDCARSEVSGSRLWGWARGRFGTAEAFFERFFVVNYCPLLFLEESGKNRTPDKLAAAEREVLFEACDRALQALVDELSPEIVVGVGAFAERRARLALAGRSIRIGTILHPSPASPRANTGWARHAEAQLAELGISMAEHSR
jgi:single-strand selective monofunctional uracil DNA glycosylase